MTSNTKNLLLAALALGLSSGIAQAQVAHLLTEIGPNSNNATGHRAYLPSAAFPRGDATVARNYRLPGLTAALAANPITTPGVPAVRDGGIAVDQQNGDVWTVASDLVYLGPCGTVPPGPCGFARQPILTREPHPDYRPFTAQSANITALIGASATGLAIDTTGTTGAGPRVLLVLDTLSRVHFLSPTIPTAVLAPPVTVVTGSISQVTGLAYDPATTSLWLTALDGTVFQSTLGGVLINRIAPSNPTFLANGAQAFGIGFNSSNGMGSFPAPICSMQVQGSFNVSVVDINGNIYDVLGTGVITAPPGIPSIVLGLGVSADQQDLGGADPNANTRLDLSAPFTNGFPASSLVVSGLPAAATGILIFDLCPLATPTPTPFGSVWFAPTATVGTVPFGPAVGGLSRLPLNPFIGAPPGIQLSFQAAVLVPGTSFSNAITVTLGLR